MGGKPGAFRARLTDSHGCHGAGQTPQEAVNSVVRTAVSFNDLQDRETGEFRYAHLPTSPDEYQKIRLDPDYFKLMDVAWDFVNEADNDKRTQEARETAELVAWMFRR